MGYSTSQTESNSVDGFVFSPTVKFEIRAQYCPVCKHLMGDMPGSRDAYCHNCGFKDPCCE